MIYEYFKVSINIILPLILLVVLSPVNLLIMLFIYISDGYPIIFKQTRIGKNGIPFIFYKFRTLKKKSNPYAESPKSSNDSSLIRGGNILRAYSLDELPQLVNILKGEMSLIGPRPLFDSHIKNLSDFHKLRLNVKPGITGLSQISMRSNLSSKKSLNMEVEYVKKKSILLDIKIIFKTIKVIIFKEGVFSTKSNE